jgi:hypothetical protein
VVLRFATSNISSSSNWPQFWASREAIQQVRPASTLLTIHNLAPHITHRKLIHVYPIQSEYAHAYAQVDSIKHLIPANPEVGQYEQILLRRPMELKEETEIATNALIEQLKTDQRFKIAYDREGVYLFDRK